MVPPNSSALSQKCQISCVYVGKASSVWVWMDSIGIYVWGVERDTRRKWVREGKNARLKVSQNLINSGVSNAVASISTDILACEADTFVEGHQASSKHQDQHWDAKLTWWLRQWWLLSAESNFRFNISYRITWNTVRTPASPCCISTIFCFWWNGWCCPPSCCSSLGTTS